MPMKLHIGLARKVGLPEYSSVSASCSVEVELNGSLVFDDLEGFHRHVRQAYAACQQSVDDELARQRQGEPGAASARSDRTHERTGNVASGNGSRRNGNGASNGRRASQKQLGFIRHLAGQISGLGVRRLDTLANKMFGKPIAGLTSLDASGLIDVLKAIKAGEIELDAALNGVGT